MVSISADSSDTVFYMILKWFHLSLCIIDFNRIYESVSVKCLIWKWQWWSFKILKIKRKKNGVNKQVYSIKIASVTDFWIMVFFLLIWLCTYPFHWKCITAVHLLRETPLTFWTCILIFFFGILTDNCFWHPTVYQIIQLKLTLSRPTSGVLLDLLFFIHTCSFLYIKSYTLQQ